MLKIVILSELSLDTLCTSLNGRQIKIKLRLNVQLNIASAANKIYYATVGAIIEEHRVQINNNLFMYKTEITISDLF